MIFFFFLNATSLLELLNLEIGQSKPLILSDLLKRKVIPDRCGCFKKFPLRLLGSVVPT